MKDRFRKYILVFGIVSVAFLMISTATAIPVFNHSAAVVSGQRVLEKNVVDKIKAAEDFDQIVKVKEYIKNLNGTIPMAVTGLLYFIIGILTWIPAMIVFVLGSPVVSLAVCAQLGVLGFGPFLLFMACSILVGITWPFTWTFFLQ